MKKFFLVLVLMLSACTNAQVTNQIEKITFKVELAEDGYPTGILKEVSTLHNLSYQTEPFPVYNMLGGTGLGKFIEEGQCDGMGRIIDGNVHLFNNSAKCYIVQVPEKELNTTFGVNLNRLRPVVSLDLLENKEIVLVDSSLSPEMQGILLAEHFSQDGSFYTALPQIVKEMSNQSFREGKYWEEIGLDESYLNVRQKIESNSPMEDFDLVKMGGLYGSVFGAKPKTEADSFHRGRFLWIYSLDILCNDNQICRYEDFMSEFQKYR